MSVLRIVRFTADPADADQILARRADLISAVRTRFPGLSETRLIRPDERTWVDSWRWDSRAAMEAAVAGAHDLPATGPAFALVKDPTSEEGEIVDER
ncbi:antibiotic biosynthesis monooxygenase [Nonomuraea sp. NPDC049419]|uniref:antibiotic biosynthesis monooxygenase n=1 Tax=Nonomuraea sp. NPDC049419 TaxID=3155772 RepID=UPI00343B4F18